MGKPESQKEASPAPSFIDQRARVAASSDVMKESLSATRQERK
jgi:hypothetical protein